MNIKSKARTNNNSDKYNNSSSAATKESTTTDKDYILNNNCNTKTTAVTAVAEYFLFCYLKWSNNKRHCNSFNKKKVKEKVDVFRPFGSSTQETQSSTEFIQFVN